MDRATISRTVSELKTNVLNSLHHQILLKYLNQPTLRERQLFFMLLPLLNENVSNNEINTATITVSIVHASLDEHAKIKEQQAVEKDQQLTVLSGDFYSGKYYELLAQSGNVELIRQISRAIVARCEAEMKVYEKAQLDVVQWVELFKVIESALIERFFYVYHFEKYTTVVEKALTIERIRNELELLSLNKPSSYVKKMLSEIDKNDVEQQLNKEADELSMALKKAIENIDLQPALKVEVLKYCS